jgi:hypothetical protein
VFSIDLRRVDADGNWQSFGTQMGSWLSWPPSHNRRHADVLGARISLSAARLNRADAAVQPPLMIEKASLQLTCTADKDE